MEEGRGLGVWRLCRLLELGLGFDREGGLFWGNYF